jgi:hypothetical protein
MNDYKRLADIIRPKDIFAEVKTIVCLMAPDFDFSWINTVYQDIIKLFSGDFVGYRKCNTRYHDLRHTEDCVLAFTRILHGAFLRGHPISIRGVNLGIISALMHDTGYIQQIHDTTGTGGKYTINHIERSIEFAQRYFTIKGFSHEDFIFCKSCLKCTGLEVKIHDIHFISDENELMGKILGVADLIGQMSDGNYLQKLPFLFEEFQEGGIEEFATEWELLQKTPDFWEFTQKRFSSELGNVDRFLKDHFRIRWGIDQDLDRLAVEYNLNRLKYILENHPADYRRHLRGELPGEHLWRRPFDADLCGLERSKVS